MEQNLAIDIYINIFEIFGMACVVLALNSMKIKDIIERLKKIKPILLIVFTIILFGTVNGFLAHKIDVNNYKFIIYISTFTSILVLNQLCKEKLPRYHLKQIVKQLDLLRVLYMYCISFILQYIFQIIAVRAAEPLKLHSQIQFMIFTGVLMVCISVISYIQPLSLSKILLLAEQKILYRLYLFIVSAMVIYVTYGTYKSVEYVHYLVFWVAFIGFFGIFIKDMILRKDTYENFNKIDDVDNIKRLNRRAEQLKENEKQIKEK